MSFGQIVKKLRHDSDMTQEQLAEMLSISAQAVSRWENDAAMPDISLIPVLANLFEVTTDFLLGVDITQKTENIQKIINRSGEIGKNGYTAEAIEILRADLAEYPGSFELMSELAGKLYIHLHKTNGKEQDRLCKEVTEICEYILANCTDEGPRMEAVQSLCYVYPMIGEYEKAEKLAEKMPNIYLSNTALRTRIYRGDRQFKAKCDHISLLISGAIRELLKLNTILDNGEEALSAEELLCVTEKAISLTDILCEDGDYGEYELYRCEAYTYQFIMKQKNKMPDAVGSLEKAADIAIAFDSSYDEQVEHTSVLLRGDEYDGFSFWQTENESMRLLNMLKECGCLAEISAQERGNRVIRKLEKYAAQRSR